MPYSTDHYTFMNLSYDEVGRRQTGGHVIYAVIKIWELLRRGVDIEYAKRQDCLGIYEAFHEIRVNNFYPWFQLLGYVMKTRWKDEIDKNFSQKKMDKRICIKLQNLSLFHPEASFLRERWNRYDKTWAF